MSTDGHTIHLQGAAAEAATILFGNGERDGELITLAALRRVLKFAVEKPSNYAMAREILMVGLMLPQECKGTYINGLAELFREKQTDGNDWMKFRTKLQGVLLKAQALVQSAEILLHDWRIEEPMLKQMDLFTKATHQESVDMTTGEVVTD